MFKQILFFIIILSNVSYAQLSNKHWLPPLHARDASVVNQQYIYLSTPQPIPFSVTVTDGAGIPISGSPFTISQGNPREIFIGNSQNSKMFRPIQDINIVRSNLGLILEGKKDFYVSFRVRSNNHAETLISKGRTGAGTDFRVGSLPQIYGGELRNFVTSFMATEDNTNVRISEYDTDVEFASNMGNITSDLLTYNLNKGESVIISGYSDIFANLSGFVGARINSTKPIIVNTGNALAGMGTEADGQDFTLDQIVPIDMIGTEYALVRGNGSNLSEFPLVIATENNTKIYVNGNTVPLITLNAGEHHLVPNSNYQGINNKNMYITSDKPIYMYQIIAGSTSDATNGLNFIPPLNCFFQKSVDLIPSINRVGTTSYTSDVIAITSNTAVLSLNGTVVSAIPQPLLGNNSWVTYKINNVVGDAKIESTGPLAVGVFGYSGVAGYGGYYSGFGSTPSDTNVSVCSNEAINLFETINGNPELNGNWVVPAGANPIVNDIFDPLNNVAGEYLYTFDKVCDSYTVNLSIKINVTIETALYAGSSSTIIICKNDEPIDLFTSLGIGAETGGTWSPPLTSGTFFFNPATDTFNSYVYTIAGTETCAASSATVTITTNPSPLLIPITDYMLCDNNDDGDDTNGIATFDLTTKSTEILNNQIGITVTYYTSMEDAKTGSNEITSINTADRIIYVRLTNDATGCFATTSFEIKVLSLPTAANSITLKQCDTDTDAITDFNLTEANSIISSDATNNFTYHTTFLGAQNNTDRITNELSYTASNGAQVWARITNTAGCFRTASVNLIVSTTTIPLNHKLMLYACDEYLSDTEPANDGFAYFNLDTTDVTQNAVENLLSFFSTTQPLAVTFYENEIDALAETNSIQDITNYRNITQNSQFIWARIDSELNNECFAVGPYIELIVTQLPEINLGTDLIICVDPITGLGSKFVDATPSIAGNYSYLWTPINPAGDSPIFEITTEGAFSVIVTNTTTNCEATATVTSSISSQPATFEANLITPAFATGLSSIEAIATGGFGIYEYSIDGIDWQPSPIFTDLENGNYIVYVRDIPGCGILFSQEIQTITYPNYFTPNADGFNDYWNINLPTQYEGKISIYDRYGKLLTKISSQEQGWNGTYNGKSLPSTDYWFRVEYIENNQKKEFKSHFSLIR
ncbi:T9SS type B sorting domain-containing protein [Flavobacterium ardleyense]|uniref:T9SS type B sorting domain-containing protein n=1 Tax=Flavobacterium ardleyense TaxID=2038737 RepID=A0ABW5Z629_9FLAO